MLIRNILYHDVYPINEHINIEIPMVREILKHESNYYSIISLLTSTPYDMMVQLDEIGVDFSLINDYELFLLAFNLLKSRDTSMIFGALDLTRFKQAVNRRNNTTVLVDEDRDIIIDRSIHNQICEAVRKIHHLDRNYRKPANDEAKDFMIRRARQKMARQRGRVSESQLEELIIALVNTEQFDYRFEDVQSLTIYQFNESVHQIIKKIDFDNKMRGIYAGTVSANDIKPKDLNWLTKN